MKKYLCQVLIWRLRKSKVSNYLLLFAALCSILSITSVSGHPFEVENCGVVKYPRSRIVGGNKAQDGVYPWMVSIHRYSPRGFDHVCGASIINEHWIVTAAHCIPHQPQKYAAIVGLLKLSKKYRPHSFIHQISEIFLHKDFESETLANDIALLKTLEPINFIGSKGYINGLCLPKTDKDPSGYAKVIGWGHTYEDGKNSDTLKEVVVPIIPRDLCNEFYDDEPEDDIDEIAETMICAGKAKRDSCQNDSGGPLFQTSTSGVSTLIGIVSHGAGCGEKYFPGIYTKVSSYKKWMEKIMSR